MHSIVTEESDMIEKAATIRLIELEDVLLKRFKWYEERDRMPLQSDIIKLQRVQQELDKRGV
jgi:hypothetical protein